MHGWRAITMPAVVFKTKVLLFKIGNTPMKETNWKRKFKRMPSFFVNKGTVFVSKLSFEEINLVFFAAKLFTCFEPTKAIKVPKKLKVHFILYGQGNYVFKREFVYLWRFHGCFVHFEIGMKEKPQNEPRFKTDFMLNFAMYSADLICVNGSKKKFHEISYLSVFIHNIN